MQKDEKQTETHENPNEGLPPLFKTWKQFYFFVLVFSALQILLYRVFTVMFSF
jgi:hypothetical protein